MNKRRIKESVITVGLSLLLMVALSPIGMLQPIGRFQMGHNFLLVVAGISFSLLTIWRLKRSENKNTTIGLILLPLAAIFIPVHVIYFDSSLSSFPSALFHFVGVLFGVLIFYAKYKPQKITLYSLLVILLLLTYLKGYSMILHKFSYGTFTGNIEKPAPTFHFEDEQGNVLTNENFKGKTLVIDFWTTTCGQCFRKFPVLEELHSKAKGRKDIVIVAVNVALKGDQRENSIKMIRERGYTFDIFFVEAKPTNEQFDFNAYPTTFIIEDGLKLTFKGSIDNVGALIGY